MKVLELRGTKSYQALQAYNTILLGLKMLPMYVGEQYADFYARVESMDEAGQAKMIREACLLVDLDREEIEILLSFAADANGVPYSAENIANLGPAEIFETIVAVCISISKIKIKFVTEAEKKN